MSRRSAAAIVIGVVLLAALGAALWFSRGLATDDRELRFVSTVSGIGGGFGEPFGIAVKGDDVFVSDGQNEKIWKITGGVTSVFAEGLHTPSGLAFDRDGNLIVADPGSNSIKSVDQKGQTTIIAGSGGSPHVSKGSHGGDTLNGPIGLAAARDGRIFIADTYNDRIRVIENGNVTTLAGSIKGFADGTDAKFDTPCGLAVWNDKLLVADAGNRRIRVVESDGRVWTLAGNGEEALKDGSLLSASFVQPTAIAVAPDNTIYIADGNAIRKIGGAIPTVRTISDERHGINDGYAVRSRFNRPSGLAIDADGGLLVADSDNRLIRKFSHAAGREITSEEKQSLRDNPTEFREAAPARWPYDPPDAKRDVAGTFGEIRGEMKVGENNASFHNGLDIAGAYGETARFMRDEKVLRPLAVDNFGTSREFIRMPTLGYIHIRIGRDAESKPFDDPRFLFDRDANNKLTGIRVPRGTEFKAREPIGTLNSMNHVHLAAGRAGSEMNALDALSFPGLSDSRPPTIEKVTLMDENWREIETPSDKSRIKLTGKTRIVIRAFDQVDGNAERRRLGIFKLYYTLFRGEPPISDAPIVSFAFDRLPEYEEVRFIYAPGSQSGATGETIFNYVLTNTCGDGKCEEQFLDAAAPGNGIHIVAEDYFGNRATHTLFFEVNR